MKKIIHEIDKTTRRISLVYPAKKNDLANAGKHFTADQKAKAKAEYQSSLKNKNSKFWSDRAEILSALAGVKSTPNMNLVVTINTKL